MRSLPIIRAILCLPILYARAQSTPAVNPAEGIQAVYRLAGQPCGIYHESSKQGPNGGTITSIESDIIFNRMAAKVEIKSSTQYTEAADGKLLALSSDQSSSQQATQLVAQVVSGSLQIKTTTGGKTYERSLQLDGDLLGPEGGRRLMARLRATGDTVSYRTFSPELGALVTMTATLIKREDVTVDQQTIPSLKLEQTMSSMPGKVTIWLDRDGWLLRQLVPSPFGDIEALRTQSKEVGFSGAALPEESFGRSIIKANIRLPEERLIENIKLKIIHHRPELGWPDLEAGNQQVIEKTADHIILKIARVGPRQSGTRPIHASGSMAPYLLPNALLQSDDSNIEKIAAKVLGNETDAWKAARALQRWTNENMHFDAGIAVAPASEVARDRRGTCFGYSMLLGSLARAAGIPSRLRMGFVYAGGIWGGHAWIEVHIGDRWIPLDSALYSPGPADAARFSFFTSSLEEGTLAQVGSLGQMYGNVDVKILEYTVEGHRVTVPEDAKPFTIDQNTYSSPWLGFSIVKPPSFHFSGVDLTWPESNIIAMDGPDQQRVEVANLSASLPAAGFDAEKYLRDAGIAGERSNMVIAGHSAVVVSSGQKAGAALLDRGNVWMFIASGPDARKLLDQTAASVVLKHEK